MGLASKIEFRELTINEKADLVFNEGMYIGVRYYYNQRINLYTIDDFFIEVWYLPSENRINKIELLEDLKTINIYIEQNR